MRSNIALALVAAVILSGCNSKEENKETKAPVQTEQSTQKVEKSGADKVAEGLKDISNDVKNKAKEGIKNVSEKTKEMAKDVGNKIDENIVKPASDAIDSAKEATKEATSNAIEATKEATSKAVDSAKEATSKAVDATKEAASAAVVAGTEVASKAVDATKEAANNVADKTKQMVKKATDATSGENAQKGRSLYTTCKSCHGANAEKKALGKSQVIADWKKEDIVNALKGYKAKTYGGAMKNIMYPQSSKLSPEQMEQVAEYITTLKK